MTDIRSDRQTIALSERHGEPQAGSPSLFSRVSSRRVGKNKGDVVFKNLTLFFAFLVFLFVFLMAYEMYRGSQLSISTFGWKFLTGKEWDPVSDRFGALTFIVGTLLSSLLALLIALPLSIATAIFLAEWAPPWIEKPVSFMVELLAGIPSIVYGLWGIFVLVPFLRTIVQPFLLKHAGWIPLSEARRTVSGYLRRGLFWRL